VIAGSVMTWAAVFVGSLVAIGCGVLAAGFLLAWSGLAVENVRRARPATPNRRPPRTAVAVLLWFVAPIVMVGGVVLLGVVSRWVDAARFEEEGSRSVVFVACVAALIVTGLVAAYLPYGYLRRASRWVGGDSSKMPKWFLAPIIAALVAITVQVLATLMIVADSADGDSSGGATAAVWVILLSIGLPGLTWLISASRAMIDLEEATRHRHTRAARAADPNGSTTVGPLNPTVAGRIPPPEPVNLSSPLL
jgi:hypothetical protein